MIIILQFIQQEHIPEHLDLVLEQSADQQRLLHP